MSVPCISCRLPAALRHDVLDRYRRGETLRALAVFVSEQGHTVSRDGLHRHLTRCVAPQDDHDIADDPAGLIVAVAVSDILGDTWPSLAEKIAERLMAEGAVAAARIVSSRLDGTVRSALQLVPKSDFSHFRLELQAFVFACRDVFPRWPPEFGRDLGDRIRHYGADDMAEAVVEVVGRDLPDHWPSPSEKDQA